jgi:Arc-like DNA binding domain
MTKNKTRKVTKRRGRPRAEKRAAPVSLRLPDEIRTRLLAAVKEKGRGSLSSEIIRRLNSSFRTEGEKDEYVLALGSLLQKAADMATADVDALRTDPWSFLAFKAAVTRLLERMTPKGEAIPPKEAEAAGFMQPEALGAVIDQTIWAMLQVLPEVPAPEHLKAADAPSRSLPYAMPNVRKALGIEWSRPEALKALAVFTKINKEVKS